MNEKCLLTSMFALMTSQLSSDCQQEEKQLDLEDIKKRQDVVIDASN